MKKLLVTGASGFLGWHLCQFPQNNWEITGTYRKNKSGIFPGIKAISLDLLDAKQVVKSITEIRPDAIVHLAANSSTGFCEKHPEETRKINVVATETVARICEKEDIQLVFTSSEQVYDGRKPVYTDADMPNPVNTYGVHKAAAERVVKQYVPESCIVRLAVLFGQHGPGTYCFMTDWLDKWKKGESVTAFYDEVRSFLSGRSAAEGLFLLLDQHAKGVYNLGGAEALSRYAFAKKLAAAFGVENAAIVSKSRLDIAGGDKRPASLVMDNAGVKAMGFRPRFFLQAMDSFKL